MQCCLLPCTYVVAHVPKHMILPCKGPPKGFFIIDSHESSG